MCQKSCVTSFSPLEPPLQSSTKKHQLSWPARRGWKRLEPMALSVSNRPASQQVCQPRGWWSLLGTLWLKDLQFFATKYRQRKKTCIFFPLFRTSKVVYLLLCICMFFSPFRPTCHFGPTNAGHTGSSRLVCLAVASLQCRGNLHGFGTKISTPPESPKSCFPGKHHWTVSQC